MTSEQVPEATGHTAECAAPDLGADTVEWLTDQGVTRSAAQGEVDGLITNVTDEVLTALQRLVDVEHFQFHAALDYLRANRIEGGQSPVTVFWRPTSEPAHASPASEQLRAVAEHFWQLACTDPRLRGDIYREDCDVLAEAILDFLLPGLSERVSVSSDVHSEAADAAPPDRRDADRG